jgi:hypothetical protein
MHDVIIEVRQRLKYIPEISSYSADEIKMARFILDLLNNEIEDAGMQHLF